MDADSNNEKSVQKSNRSTTIEIFSFESLINRVDEFQRRDYLDTIERLTIENSLLENVVVKYRRNWCLTIDVLENAYQAMLTLEKALENYIIEDIAAEKQWLLFWGIKKECTMRQNYSPAGWL